jgi:S-adenosylmethionine synthetase
MVQAMDCATQLKGHIYFASESVGEGHPDKMCDQVSDAIVDACIKVDPACRVAMETASKSKTLCLLGEVSVTSDQVDFEAVARKAVNDIGFNSWEQGMNGTEMKVITVIEAQDANIAAAVIGSKKLEDIGAGDQGIMFGYATNEYD